MSDRLKEILRAEIASHDYALWTTPHLSRIRNAEQALLDLLEVPEHMGSLTMKSDMGERTNPRRDDCTTCRRIQSCCPGCHRVG